MPCVEAELQNSKSHTIPCAKAELRDLKPKLLCGSGTAERQVAVYFLCGSGTTEHIWPTNDMKSVPHFCFANSCAEVECQTLKSHNILCAEVELRNLKVSVQWKQNLKYRMCSLMCTRVLPYFCLHCIFLVQRLNCGTAELQDKEYSVCGSRTAELKVATYSLSGSGTVELQVTEYSVCGSGPSSQNILRVEYLWFLMPEWHESAGVYGPWIKAILEVPLFTVPSWLWHLLGFLCVFSPLLSSSNKSADVWQRSGH